jgi:hypothetical protein
VPAHVENVTGLRQPPWKASRHNKKAKAPKKEKYLYAMKLQLLPLRRVPELGHLVCVVITLGRCFIIPTWFDFGNCLQANENAILISTDEVT